MPDLHSDFCITIDFVKESENPARVFETMTELINTFQRFDSRLIKGIDTKLQPEILLEDVETGSLKTWLSSVLRGVPDEALKEGDWKKVIGHYLMKSKYIVLNKLEGQVNITDAKVIEDIQGELAEEAEKTDVKLFPHYEPLPLPELLNSIDEISKSLEVLDEKDNAYFESKTGDKATFNMALQFSKEAIEDLLTKETLSNKTTKILKVKKPDYLGSSMWDFKHNKRLIPAKILDENWLIEFQKRKKDIRPGDSIKANVNTIIKYGHDNEVIATKYEILEVLKILPYNRPDQKDIFE